MRRTILALTVFALALAALGTPTLAGGWAVTTFDDMPGQIVSGKDYALGYTIRQHGATPVNVSRTEIVAVAVSGRTLSFPGRPDGAVGHYVATVFFPAGGTYTWHVTQGEFAPQDLGRLSVIAAAGTTTDDKKVAADKTATDKGLATDKAAALDKAAAAEKAAVSDKAAPGTTTTTTSASPSSTQPGDPVRSARPFAAAAAAALFIWRLVTMVRSSRRATA